MGRQPVLAIWIRRRFDAWLLWEVVRPKPSTAAWHTLFPSPGKEDPLVRAPPDPSEVACLGRMPDGCFPLERRATRWLLAKTPSAKAPDCVRRDGNDPCPGGDGGSLEDNPDGIPTVW